MTLSKFTGLLLLCVVAVACGPSGGGDAGQPTIRTNGYPAAPYGVKEGDVIENLSFQTPDGQTFTLNDIFKDEKNRVLLLSTTAGWCSACREEQARLVALHDEFNPKGLQVMGAIFEDDRSKPATTQLATDWVRQYSLDFPFVADTPFVLQAYYDRQATPMNMVVDVDTMTIKMIRTGFDEQAVTAVIKANLPP